MPSDRLTHSAFYDTVMLAILIVAVLLIAVCLVGAILAPERRFKAIYIVIAVVVAVLASFL